MSSHISPKSPPYLAYISNRLGKGISEKMTHAFSGARFPSTLVAAATVSFVLCTLLCVGCCAVRPYLLQPSP